MVEKIYAEQIGKTEPIYSLLSTTREDLSSMERMPSNDTKSGPTSPSSLPRQTLTELNSMATTVINTIGFVPRAISSAVVDTFRSRSTRTSASPLDGGKAESVAPETARLRKKVVSLKSTDSLEDLSLKEIRLIIDDYRKLLDKIKE